MKTKSFFVAVVAVVVVTGLCSFTSQNIPTTNKLSEEVSSHVHAQGFGRCSKCYCKSFEGRAQTCRNCGHAYKAHY